MADLSDFKRGQIVAAHVAGARVTKTAKLFGLARSTVSKVMIAFGKQGKASSLKQTSGRKRKLFNWDRLTLTRVVRKNHKNMTPKITPALNEHFENPLERSSIKPDFTRGLQSENYKKIKLFEISNCFDYFVRILYIYIYIYRHA